MAASQAGRKTTYHPKYAELATALIGRGGWNQSQVMDKLNIAKSTWYRWIADHEEFRDSVGEARLFQIGDVIDKLYLSASGCEYDEVTHEPNDSGELAVSKVVKKKIMPNANSIQYLLNNRDAEHWKRVPVESDQQKDAPIVPIIFAVNDAIGEVEITRGADHGEVESCSNS